MITRLRAVTCLVFLVAEMNAACYAGEAEDLIYRVSLVRLLVATEEFAGTRVDTVGYLSSYGNLGLFLTKDHADVFDLSSSLTVYDAPDGSIITSECLNNYVQLYGRIEQSQGWVITEVEEITRLTDISTCWKRAPGTTGLE